MSWFRSSSLFGRLAASLALVGWVGLSASLCLCAHAAGGAVTVVEALPSCHAAEPAPGGAAFSSACCQVGQPAPPALTLDSRGPRNDPPAGGKVPAFAAHWLRPSFRFPLQGGASAAPPVTSPPHAPPLSFVLPLRI